ncbi:fabD [Wigglesworthia glossinidia endosymbiont of Glossina brevipalpis]|uniref:Malonyl CoA-acyl carrier protein transacylase n=1 Tax=Wigglesworthia glossinidia brevipalpis TaxID=36870 RepID=Q8D3B1_WIGBR|nr:fabD [Wigglesworthia glossinidia endosymbiont of Glossina brevipalpis]
MKLFSMVFPGQGSQFVGMLKSLSDSFIIVKEVFEESSEILKYDLWKLAQEGPLNILNKTEITQPAILTASFAIWKVWNSLSNINPIFMAGHSLGEYSALVCAKSLNFSDAIKITSLRGKFMQESLKKECAMAAIIGLPCTIIDKICKRISIYEFVEIANFNSPMQIIISGYKNSVIKVIKKSKKLGAKYAKLLSVNVPAHSVLMKPASKKLSYALNKIKIFTPKIKVISSLNVKVQKNPKEIKKNLIKQIYKPVLWNNTIKYLIEKKIKIFLEVGPGNILSKLLKSFSQNTNIYGISIQHPEIIIKESGRYNKL